MSDLASIIKAKDAAEADLLKIPGVNGVAIGKREKGGTTTDEIVIHVYVTRKRAPQDVSVQERIPAEIRGFKTDVIERASDLHTSLEDYRVRPVPAGVHITVYPIWAGGRGTICCFVKSKRDPKKVFLLTAAHVMNPNYKTDKSQTHSWTVSQPANDFLSIFRDNMVAGVTKYVYEESVDAGISQLFRMPSLFDAGDVEFNNYVWRIGPITSTGTAVIGERVRKHGATTELTCGKVKSISASRRFEQTGVTLKDLFTIDWLAQGSDSKTFCEPGDSGAPVVNDAGQLVGILIGKSGTGGSACNISNVFGKLDVELASPKGKASWPPT